MGLAQAYSLRNLSAAQALEIGRFATNDLRDKIARAQAICALVKAWAEAADRIRIIRGQPLPGSLRPIPNLKKNKHTNLPAPTESGTIPESVKESLIPS